MLILQDINKMRLTVYIPEDYVDKVDLRQPVTFTFNAMPGRSKLQKSAVRQMHWEVCSPEAIEIDVTNKNGQLKPGMYAEVKIPMRFGCEIITGSQ